VYRKARAFSAPRAPTAGAHARRLAFLRPLVCPRGLGLAPEACLDLRARAALSTRIASAVFTRTA
jgi:hypothetical protein